jgi:hypothetical protein
MIVVTCGLAEACCGFSKDGIAYEMPIAIVDLLEMVEVSDKNCKRLMVSFSTR